MRKGMKLRNRKTQMDAEIIFITRAKIVTIREFSGEQLSMPSHVVALLYKKVAE